MTFIDYCILKKQLVECMVDVFLFMLNTSMTFSALHGRVGCRENSGSILMFCVAK
jgi:hypothetical protein